MKIYVRRAFYHARRHVLRLVYGHCTLVSAGMNCSGWWQHNGPHTFTNREWRRTRPASIHSRQENERG